MNTATLRTSSGMEVTRFDALAGSMAAAFTDGESGPTARDWVDAALVVCADLKAGKIAR